MRFRSVVPALIVALLALFPAVAQGAPWTITYSPDSPVAGQDVSFDASKENGNASGESLVWDFGDGSPTAAGRPAVHSYASSGQYTVTLSEPDDQGTLVPVADPVTVNVQPPPNTRPSAAFIFMPENPLVGESVLFTGGTDSDGDALTRVWDFGDGTPTSSAAEPAHSYAASGSYTVALSVSDERGGFDSSSQTVSVSSPPGDGSAPGAGSAPGDGPALTPSDPILAPAPGDPDPIPAPGVPAKPPTLMRPFPVVRIAGVVLPRGALVTILSVRGPVGARVFVQCSGRGCPSRSVARTSTTRLLRLRRFERRLPAGVTLELFVRQAGRIGKYTRFTIRAGKAPARLDRCLVPGRTRPVMCE